MRVVNCIPHRLGGPSILYACGIHRDGVLEDADQYGCPKPVVLILPAGSAARKLNTVRVAMSQWGKGSKLGRFYEVRSTNPIRTTIPIRDMLVAAECLTLYFVPGTNAMKVRAAYMSMIS